eukprot:gnl/Hemi2/13173_TR4508_c0_g1_i1.p2 gnl/Hemi2/13173_TR4508_c0_g1~~gnl/Hemi2/13173_TR4508_c0_g1_i1.p2  ORF type:complete len:286 (+),score=33.01 gnl/Hemi2/13173_TR4508_c0_g1_i1:568-1425(+)
MSLKLQNFDQVLMVRGNHEDLYLASHYGLLDELMEYASTQEEAYRLLQLLHYRLFAVLPVAMYLGIEQSGGGVDFIQCFHGGLEIGVDPTVLLKANSPISTMRLTYVDRIKGLQRIGLYDDQDFSAKLEECHVYKGITPHSPASDSLGMLWNDYSLDRSSRCQPNRGMAISEDVSRQFIEHTSPVRVTFRAHQHHSQMLMLQGRQKGIVKLWPSSVDAKNNPGGLGLWTNAVVTFLSAPESNLGWQFDSFGVLSTLDGKKLETWPLMHCWRDRAQRGASMTCENI